MATATTSAPQEQVGMPSIDLRRLIGALISADGVSSSTDLNVTQRGAGANMSVDVSSGSAYVKDDHAGGGGYYGATWTATQNVAIAAADPSNPRVDRVVLRIRDAYLGDAANDITLFIVQGTPTTGATLANCSGAGAVPGSCLLLANVLVGAGVTSITTANIDATGASNGNPTPRPVVGLTGASTTLADTTLGADTASIDIQNLPGGYPLLRVTLWARSDRAANVEDGLGIRFNNDTGATQYDCTSLVGPNTTPTSSSNLGQSSIQVNNALTAATATAGYFSAAAFTIPNYTEAANPQQIVGHVANDQNPRVIVFGGLWKGTGVITRITLLPVSGTNLKSTSRASVTS